MSVPAFRSKKSNYSNYERVYYKVRDRMKRLNANGYYLVHNHPSGKAKASFEDIRTTKAFFEKNLRNFAKKN